MLRYGGPFLFLGAIPALFYALGPSGPLLSLAAFLACLLLAEAIAPRGDGPLPGAGGPGYRALVLAYIPAHIAALAWAVWLAPRLDIGGLASLAAALGVTGGVFGVLAAHEAVHSGDRREALLGQAMLTAICYRHFRIAHLHGHHRWAGTERDAATARAGEGFYAFLVRTLVGQFREAWVFEQRRAGWRGNRVLGDLAVMAMVFGLIGGLFGPRALAFLLAQGALAVLVLELFNYVAHYGLARRLGPDGRRERLTDRHSWNSSNVLANALIFNMGRHSCHHEHPAASFERLRARQAPELPLGYAGSLLLALAPPLWRRTMDPHVRSWMA
jgi:alkane 1-monooxygenase